MGDLTELLVDMLWDELAEVYGGRRRRKRDSWLMGVIARVLAWRGYMPRERFARMATTVGRTVYLPEFVWVPELRDLPTEVALAVHEYEHVAQWGWRFWWRYVTRPAWRAQYEGQAYATNLALWYWATGQWLNTAMIADKLVRCYGVSDEDAAGVYRYLEQEKGRLEQGRVSSARAALAMSWLEGRGVHGVMSVPVWVGR